MHSYRPKTPRPIRYTLVFDVSHAVSRDLPRPFSFSLFLRPCLLRHAIALNFCRFLLVPPPSFSPSTSRGNPNRGGRRQSAGALCKMRRKAAGNESNVLDVSIISSNRDWPLSAAFSTPTLSMPPSYGVQVDLTVQIKGNST